MYLLRQNNKTDYNYKEFYLDTLNELNSVDIKDACPGSVAYIISSSDVYILNANGQWIPQTGEGGGGGSAVLQTKDITITENTLTIITPDTGYDGLSSVNVTTNIEGGGSQEIEEASALVDQINGEVI